MSGHADTIREDFPNATPRPWYRISDGGRDWYTAWVRFVPQEAACL